MDIKPRKVFNLFFIVGGVEEKKGHRTSKRMIKLHIFKKN